MNYFTFMTHLDVLEADELSSNSPGPLKPQGLGALGPLREEIVAVVRWHVGGRRGAGELEFFSAQVGGWTKKWANIRVANFFLGGVGGGVLCECVGVDVSGKNSETRIWKRFHGLRLFPCRLKHPSVTHFSTSVSYLIISSMSLPAEKGIVGTAFYALVLRLLKPTECSDVMWGAVKKTTVPWVQRPLECEAQISSDLFFKTGMDGRHGRWSIFFSSQKWMIRFRPKKWDLVTSILAWPW